MSLLTNHGRPSKMTSLDSTSMEIGSASFYPQEAVVPRRPMSMQGAWWKLPLAALMVAAAVPAVAVGAAAAVVAGAAMLGWLAFKRLTRHAG